LLTTAPGLVRSVHTTDNLASLFYDRNKEGDDEHCFGGECWSTIFMVTGFLCVIGGGITFFLAWRRKNFLQ
jgi:hypothetical protein